MYGARVGRWCTEHIHVLNIHVFHNPGVLLAGTQRVPSEDSVSARPVPFYSEPLSIAPFVWLFIGIFDNPELF